MAEELQSTVALGWSARRMGRERAESQGERDAP
jgi:hypothetical protein